MLAAFQTRDIALNFSRGAACENTRSADVAADILWNFSCHATRCSGYYPAVANAPDSDNPPRRVCRT